LLGEPSQLFLDGERRAAFNRDEVALLLPQLAQTMGEQELVGVALLQHIQQRVPGLQRAELNDRKFHPIGHDKQTIRKCSQWCSLFHQ